MGEEFAKKPSKDEKGVGLKWIACGVAAVGVLASAIYLYANEMHSTAAVDKERWFSKPSSASFPNADASASKSQPKPHSKPTPPSEWKRSVFALLRCSLRWVRLVLPPCACFSRLPDGRRIFEATDDWQDVPDDCVVPAGLHISMDMSTGKVREARMQRRARLRFLMCSTAHPSRAPQVNDRRAK
jgi:hypothetical protein